ncbi:TetR family transcriptional regulator [Nocardioides mangrovi]|uniref:TetR family transcriptional regulator n=1 Tax=Nocardioides mangrovi TaxID=2874580 RepID=A0ABS7U759_9ACTN|nr:TetR family transcriptional regulator [Nocardioides mangrovi]MBZ5736527.1 TetR family transcriptional regulator [Nocardioides mangrovi]
MTDRGTTPPPEQGRRETHKASTRRALEDAALRRFAEDGFDQTSVESIAADAGVSTRTFFRYFATKDEVLDMGRDERQAELRAALRELVRRDLSDFEVVRAAVATLARSFEDDRERVELRQRAAASSVLLRGRVFDMVLSWEYVVARELGGDVAAQSLAAAGFGVFRAAATTWMFEGGSLTDLVNAGFDALR